MPDVSSFDDREKRLPNHPSERSGEAARRVHNSADGLVLPDKVDEYRLLAPLGRGAMGQVYLGHDTLLDRLVAIKFVAAIRAGAELRDRFLIEARAFARLHHPNVVTIYRVGTFEGYPFLVYEFVRGQSLAELAKPLPWPQALKIAIELSRGLAAAHRRGVLHRDIKPANVLLSESEEVKLLDFGLAKLLEESFGQIEPNRAKSEGSAKRMRVREPQKPSAGLEQTLSFVEEEARSNEAEKMPSQAGPEITHPGARLGTPLYMAPEIWCGAPGSERSDIYSLGAVIYELLTGRPPHQARNSAELERLVVDTDAEQLGLRMPAVEPKFAAAVDMCLRRDPEERHRSAAALCQLLEGLTIPGDGAAVPQGNPYRGLRPFEPSDRPLLFGRSQDIRAVIELLRTEPFVLVIGDSGVGKSSLCRAGVLSQFCEAAKHEGRRWSQVPLSPGRWPLQALADALVPHLRMRHGELVHNLRHDAGMVVLALNRHLGEHYGLLLFLDQMEEFVTQSSSEDAAAIGGFLSQISQRLPGVRVLGAVRSDFLTRLVERTHLSHELSRGIYPLRPLSTPDLREAITGPTRLMGISFESNAMVESMVESTVSAQGGLPLLQFTLAQLWDRRDIPNGIIRTDSLDQIGGVAGSLARYADGVLDRLLPEQRAAARRLLLRLVRSDGTRLSRNESELLTGDPAENNTLDALVRARLLVARRVGAQSNAYELSHEALVSGWTRLRDWLSQDQERQLVIERVEAAALEWERLNQPQELLWRSLQLAEVDTLNVESVIACQRVKRFLTESRRYTRLQQRIKRGMYAFLLVCALATAILSTRWWQEAAMRLSHQAEQIRRKVMQSGRENEAMIEALRLMRDHEQGDRTPPEVDETLLDVLMSPGRELPEFKHEGPVRWVEFSPDGTRILSASDDHTAGLWDTATGARIALLAGHTDRVVMARFSPNGALIITASADKTARLWSGLTGQFLGELKGHEQAVNVARFSPDGKAVLTVSDDSRAVLWDVETRQPRVVLGGHKGPVLSGAFSPDGEYVVTSSADKTAHIWSRRSGAAVFTLTGHTAPIQVVSYSPKGDSILTGSADFTARIWDAKTGLLRAVLQDHKSPIIAAEFSPDGARIVTAASNDIAARIWDAGSGLRLMTLSAHLRPLIWATFSPDGSRLATMGSDHLVRLWHGVTGAQLGIYHGHRSNVLHAAFPPGSRLIATAGEDQVVQVWTEQLGGVKTLAQHQGPVWAAAMTPDGQIVATGSGDTKVRLWETATGRHLAELAGHQQAILSVAISPNGQWLATAGLESDVLLWSIPERRRKTILRGHSGRVQWVTFSSNGSRLLSVSFDRTARIWSIPEGRLIQTLVGHTDQIYRGQFSPDGRYVVTASVDHTARVWEVSSGLLLRTLEGHRAPLWFAGFSPDGRHIITTSEDNTARLWNSSTGELEHWLQGHADCVSWAAFSPDNGTVVTASMDGTGIGWDVQSGQVRYSLIGHREAIFDVEFSREGDTLVTASADHSARLWRASTGQSMGVLRGHLGPITMAHFSNDGSHVITASGDNTARIYAAERKSWIAQACIHLSRWSHEGPSLEDLCLGR